MDTLILLGALVLHTVVVLRIGFRQGVDVERARTVLADPLSPQRPPQGQEPLLQGYHSSIKAAITACKRAGVQMP